MSLQKLINNYAGYNLWANKTLIDWLKTKPAELLNKEVPSSFPSVIKSLAHLWDTERFWLLVLQGANPVWRNFEGTNEEVQMGLLKESEIFSSYVHSLSEAELLEDCILDTPWAKGQLPKYEFIQHCFNHASYHRGQIITIGRNVGLTDAPNTDYNYYNMVVKGR
jgi:uncharacterized damage-inducible protein DinB